MLVSALVYQELKYSRTDDTASVETRLYLFNNRRWVDIDANRTFRERIGPVGIHVQSDKIGPTEILTFPEKQMYSQRRDSHIAIEFVDTWSLDEAWLFVLSLPAGAAARSLKVLDSDDNVVPTVVGIGTDGKLCYYLYSRRQTMLRTAAFVEFNKPLYSSVRKSIGRIATQEEYDAVSGVRTARWELDNTILHSVEDPPGIRWVVANTAKVARELGSLTNEGAGRNMFGFKRRVADD